MKFIGLEFENRLELKKWLGYTLLPIPAVIILFGTQAKLPDPFIILSVSLLLLSGLNNLCEKHPENNLLSPACAGIAAVLTEIVVTTRANDIIGLLIIGLVTAYVNRSAYWAHLAIEKYVTGKVQNG